MPNIRSFYVTVLSQALSPCEEFLAAGTNFGNINIFNTRPMYEDEEAHHHVNTSAPSLPQKCFSASTKPLQAMLSINDNLLVGGRNSVIGYSWDEIKTTQHLDQEPKPSWSVDLHLPTDFGTKETVDCIIEDDKSSVFAACGDNKIHHVDLEYGKVKMALTGHTDFIHSMSRVGNQLSSASEDGTVCIWDTRKLKPVHVIHPHTDSRLVRPRLGSWIAAVAMNEDWLVCGGGPHLALYHLRSLTMSQVLLEHDSYGINSVMFYEDSIIVGLDGPFVYHCLFSGDVTVKMPTTPLRIYTTCVQTKHKNKLLFAAGASGDIDICASSKLRDQVIRCLS